MVSVAVHARDCHRTGSVAGNRHVAGEYVWGGSNLNPNLI